MIGDKKYAVTLGIVTLILSLLVSLPIYMIFGKGAVVSFLVPVPVGFIAHLFLISDIKNAFNSYSKGFLLVRFILRLATFAILLYVMLVTFRLNPIGVALGFTFTIFCAIFINVYDTIRLTKVNQ